MSPFLRSLDIPEGAMQYVDTISMQELATRASKGKFTVLSVKGSGGGPHAVSIVGWKPVKGRPGGSFLIRDPLTATEYWLSAESLNARCAGTNVGDALLFE